MSGHSKWSTIKHAKGAADAKRGQLFTKLTREIIVAVREGGSSPDTNFRLRLAIQKSRDASMPNDNIERSIKKGAGELGGATMSDVLLEGYGPGGTAIMVKALSDNRNRTIQDVRNIFARHGGSMGESGCVSWLFNSQGVITIKAEGQNLEEIELNAIDAGAEDVKADDGIVEVYTKPEKLEKIKAALEQKQVQIASTEISMVSKSLVQLDEKAALTTLKLLSKLEELDEVQSVYSNADFPATAIESYQLQQA